MGLAHKNMESYDYAEKALIKAATLKPDDAEVHRALGVIYEKIGDYDKAALSFRKAIDINDSDILSYVNLGVVLIHKKQVKLFLN